MMLHGVLYIMFYIHRIFVSAKTLVVLRTQEQMLHREYRLLDALLAQLPCIIWCVDENLIYTMFRGTDRGFSENTYEMVGHHISEAQSVLGRPKEYVERVEGIYKDIIKTGTPKSFILESKERSLMSFLSPLRNLDGRIHGIVGMGLDITQQTRTQHALAQSEAQYRNLVDAISDHIFHVDRTGRIQFANRDFLDQPKTGFLGKNFHDFFAASPQMHRRAILAFRSVIEHH
jgi:PAS domain-containing protein